jgi:thiamine-monophosphate kinase
VKEFQLIRQIQREAVVSSNHDNDHGVVLGIGDDAAQHRDRYHGLRKPRLPAESRDVGFKCLAINLSDLAAMGAIPHWVLLSLSLPTAESAWVKSFTSGFMQLARAYDVSLVGGDTCSGPLSVGVTALGSVEPGRQLTRSGAGPGDLLVVSGTIGGAAHALDMLKTGNVVTDRHLLDRPRPRVELGQALAGYASACIDVSDGLLADLGHVLKASGCGARLDLDKLPHTKALAELETRVRWNYQLSGGDDYELLFTLPRSHQAMVPIWSQQLNIRLSIIGEIEDGNGVRCYAPDGAEFDPDSAGFEHFGDMT